MENKPSVEGKINKWKEVKAEYDKWLPTIELKYRKGKTIYTQIAEIFPAILDDLAILKMDFASQLAQRDKEIEGLKRLLHDLTPGGSEFYNDPKYCAEWVRKNREENHYALAEQVKEAKKQRDHYKALAEAGKGILQFLVDSINGISIHPRDYDEWTLIKEKYQSLKTQTP